jgi:hypothetical protein
LRFILALGALLAMAGGAAAHYGGDDNWHDFGTNLGAFGPSPVGAPIGVCWFTDSTFLDASDPGGFTVQELNGHQGGVGVDEDGDCDEQAENPSTYVRLGVATSLLPGGGAELVDTSTELAVGSPP